MNDDSLYTAGTDTQFVLSHELICLLRWMLKHDAKKLKKIIATAVYSGLRNDLQKDKTPTDVARLEDLQEVIVDFFGMLEGILLESLDEHAVQKAIEKNLLPSIDQIDSTICDDATVRFSVEKATSDIEKNTNESPKDLLFKELLRHWKPNKKSVAN